MHQITTRDALCSSANLQMISGRFMRTHHVSLKNRTGGAKLGAISSQEDDSWKEGGGLESDLSFGDTRVCSQNVKIYKYHGCVVLGSQIPSFVQYTVGYFSR